MTTWTPYRLRELLDHLTGRDLRILEALEQFRLLTTTHVRRLEFSEGHATQLAATRGAVRVLGRLEGGGFVSRLERRVGGPLRGSSASIWQLSAVGERVLRARRGDATRRRYEEPSPHFTRHTLAVSDLGVRVVERVREARVTLLELSPEPASWRSFTNALGGLTWVRPDLFVATADMSTETHVWCEVDLGTEHLPTIERKCAVYQRYFDTGTEQAKRGVFPLVLWVVPDERRADRIRGLLEKARSLDASLFAVSTADDVMEVLAPPDPDQASASTTTSPERRNP